MLDAVLTFLTALGPGVCFALTMFVFAGLILLRAWLDS